MGSKSKNKKNKDKVEAVSSGDGAQGSGSKHDDGKSRGEIITDARFASVHSDPRFMEAPKNKAKVSIDSRFNHMFTDKNFASSKARIDKRGKPKKKDVGAESLKHYYQLEEEEEEERAKKIERIEQLFKDEESGSDSEELMGEDDESEGSGSEDSEEDKRKKKNLKVKNESEESESEDVGIDDDSSSSTTDSDEEEDAELYEEEEGALVQVGMNNLTKFCDVILVDAEMLCLFYGLWSRRRTYRKLIKRHTDLLWLIWIGAKLR